jgi:cysteine synthase
VLGAGSDHLLELSGADRRRIFNLGYFTWVEQQGIPHDDFIARRRPEFWTGLREWLAVWDGQIDEFNAQTGVAARP